MPYIKLDDNTYPLYIGDIQLVHPGATHNNLPEGYADVAVPERPELAEDEKAVSGTPVLVDGEWVHVWEVVKLSAEELEQKLAPIRARQKLVDLGFTVAEIEALIRGLR